MKHHEKAVSQGTAAAAVFGRYLPSLRLGKMTMPPMNRASNLTINDKSYTTRRSWGGGGSKKASRLM